MIREEQAKDVDSVGRTIFGYSGEVNETKIFSDEYFIKNCFVSSPREGFELLFRKYYGNLCNHAIRFVYSREMAEDIVAEVFANFWNNEAHRHITGSFRSYLYIAVRNRAYTCIKQELSRNTNLDSTAEDAHQYTMSTVLQPDEITHFHELSHKLDIAIQHLPQQSRKAFQLNRLDGKKYSEVASEMGLTVSAVERLISRALAKIRAEIRIEYFVFIFSLRYWL
ncbi:RNA polymerase sigma-70 factor [Fibrella aquatica]|jgi:RNA polymerase sigma-70 factor (family 1)|uniref:RNA polymerase sigma-70 factor n=1 Tax=Fibrella aquatica TaxID=3242487 RepID=UPI00351FD83F